jgi:hypothetical protein
MGAYYKLGLIVLIILFLVIYSFFFYHIYPKFKIYRIKKVLLNNILLNNIDTSKLTPSLKIELINKLFSLEKLKPIDYGFIFFNREKEEFILLKNSNQIELAQYNINFPKLHNTNKLFNILKCNLFSNKEYSYAYYNNILYITKKIKSNIDYMIFISFPSISLFKPEKNS